MAIFARQVSCFLLFVAFVVTCQIEARESKFFSKQIHLTILRKGVTIPSTATPAPSPAPITNYISNAPTPAEYAYAPAPLDNTISNAPSPAEYDYAPAPIDNSQAPSPTESEGAYYGLYGKGTNSFLSDTGGDVNGNEFNNQDTEVLSYSDPNTYVNSYSSSDPYTYVDSYSGNLNEENEFSTWNQEGYNGNNNVDNFEPQGMSDTRLVDNDKYFYDVEQENYVPNGQDMSRNNNLNGGYFGNYEGKSNFEFDTMKEYEKQEGYPDFQQEFQQEFNP